MTPQLTLTKALTHIDDLFDQELIGDATYQFAADVIGLCFEEQVGCPIAAASAREEFRAIKTADELAEWRRADVKHWQEEDLDEQEFAERFEVGPGRSFGCIEQMLGCTDFEFVLQLLPQITGEPA